ncbi:MAG TPA: Rdx family protein [Gaiellaceae bacterium]|nr:Rdx family protein [Gaiellaceae bacterium]
MKDTGFDASIREGQKSQFDVFADGELVFSKLSERRWPADGEVLALLTNR